MRASEYLPPEYDGGNIPGIDPRLAEALDDPLLQVMKLHDPNHELDPDYSLLDDCAHTASDLRDLYKDLAKFPDDFLPKLYGRELQYMALGISGLRNLLALNAQAGNTVRIVRVLWDFDRSQIAVADTPKGDMYHLPRPGWAHLVRRMESEASPAILENGALSDRPQKFDADQTTNDSGHGLVEYAAGLFAQAGILRFLEPSLVISSTDGPAAEALRPHLQSGMRRRLRRLPLLSQLQIESGQFNAIDAIVRSGAHREQKTRISLKSGHSGTRSKTCSVGCSLFGA